MILGYLGKRNKESNNFIVSRYLKLAIATK